MGIFHHSYLYYCIVSQVLFIKIKHIALRSVVMGGHDSEYYMRMVLGIGSRCFIWDAVLLEHVLEYLGDDSPVEFHDESTRAVPNNWYL